MERRHSHHQFITLGGTSSRPKYTTRHLAALDFLLNVPMQKEASIRQVGIENATKLQRLEESEGMETNTMNKEPSVEESTKDPISPISLLQDSTAEFLTASEAAGKKLQGPSAPVGRFPPSLRYLMLKTSVQGAMYRQWEDKLLDKLPSARRDTSEDISQHHSHHHHSHHHSHHDPSVTDSRIFFSRARSYPTMVFSIIQFDAKEEKARQEKLKGGDDTKQLKVYELPHRDWRGFSYKPLFKQLQEERNGDYWYERGYLYDPNCLDDPDLLYGSHRYVLSKSSSTGPIISSIILYVNKKELKESLNEKFHQSHANLPISLTLSKIRKLKKDILFFAIKHDIELSTIALAIVYFERLCLKGLVSKVNRRLSMATCLLLAVKFNETTSQVKYRKILDILIDYFDKEWNLPKKQIFEAEFGVYVHLGFLMHIPYQHIYNVYLRLLKILNKSNRAYLKDDMIDIYMSDIMRIEKAKETWAKEREANAATTSGAGVGVTPNDGGEDAET
jgi:hypothetical protein